MSYTSVAKTMPLRVTTLVLASLFALASSETAQSDRVIPEGQDLLEAIPGFVSSLAHNYGTSPHQSSATNPEASRIRASTVAYARSSAPGDCGASHAFDSVPLSCCHGDGAIRTDISASFFGGGSCYYSQGVPFRLSGFGKCDASNHFIYGELCHNHSTPLPGYPAYPHPPRLEQRFTNPSVPLQCGCALDSDWHFDGNTDCTYGCHRLVRTPPERPTCWRITDFTQHDVLTSLQPARDSGQLVIPPAFDAIFNTQFFLLSEGCTPEDAQI